MKLKKSTTAALILLVPTGLASVIYFTQRNQAGDTVIEIIDGDTFKIQNKQTIRLASIDAPELDRCLGQESKEALSKLIFKKKVILLEPYADRYGRITALVIGNGQIINEVMVRNGYAVDTYDNFSAKKALQEANDYARKNKLGIFSPECSQTIPPDSACFIKGNHDQRQNRKLYSYPGCTNYNRTVVDLWQDDRWFCSEEEAIKAGYTRSGDCQSDPKALD